MAGLYKGQYVESVKDCTQEILNVFRRETTLMEETTKVKRGRQI